MLATPFKIEIPIIAPTTACELDTGTNGIVGKPRFNKNVSRPRDANINKTIECEITAIKAVVADADGKDTVSVPPDTDLVLPKSNTAMARLLADEL